MADADKEPANESLANEGTQAGFAKTADQLRVRGNRFVQFYANNISVSFSTWDLSLSFGEIVGTKDGKPVIEEIARINVTRELAKVASRLLAANIEGYEKQFGEIRIPELETAKGFSEVEEESAE